MYHKRTCTKAIAGVALTLVVSTSAMAQLSGKVKLDGSSTVAPITMAAAELFRAEQPRIRVTVGSSGTGGGLRDGND